MTDAMGAMKQAISFDEAMVKEGMPRSTINSTTYAAIKRVILKNPEWFTATAIGEDLGSAMAEAADLCEALRQQHGEALDEYIRDESKRDAVRVFGSALRTVQNTFGADKMTDEVITKAIEAASYMAYRAIMGEAATPYAKRV